MASSFANSLAPARARVLARALVMTLALAAGISDSHAAISIPVVNNYLQAASPDTWKQISDSDIPASLIQNVQMPTPPNAYAAPYTGVFLQNQRVIVCYESCDSSQPLHPVIQSSANYTITGDGRDDVKITRLTSTYYWINKLFDRMSALGFTPSRTLMVLVDRDVADPTSGIELANNAFFNPNDWSLSFLPSHQSIYAKEKNLDFANSANDPSVIIHETVHSVFQAMIGSILNSEVYGLHEAFADYFALSLLNSNDVGLVAGKGNAIRTAASDPIYHPRMEAHELGNVVLAALWKIRSLYKDKTLADRVALETIRQVSLNPFSTAGNVVTAYSNAFQLIVQKNTNESPDLGGTIQMIWNPTDLNPTPPSLDMKATEIPLKNSKSVSAIISTTMPPGLASNFSYPEHTEATISQYEFRANHADSNLVWYRVGYTEGSTQPLEENSFWIVYDKITGCILAAYDLAMTPIVRDSALFGSLLGIGNSLDDMINLTSDFSNSVRSIYLADDASSPYSKFLRIGPVHVSSGTTLLNGMSYKMSVNTRSVKANLTEGIKGIFDPTGLGATLDQTKFVTLFTVGATATSGSMELVPLQVQGEDQQYIIGYSEVSATNASRSLILRTAN